MKKADAALHGHGPESHPASRPRVRDAVRLALGGLVLFLACLIGNEVSAQLRFPDDGSAIVYLPYAFLTAALLLSRPAHWWIFLLASFVAHALPHWAGWAPDWVLMAETANLTKALVAAIGIRHFSPAPQFDSLGRTVIFIVFGVFIGPATGAFIGAGNVVLHDRAADFWLPWRTWFLSNALPGATLLPALLMVATRRRAWLRMPAKRKMEAGLLLIVLLVVSLFAFFFPLESFIGMPAALYAPLPIFLWAIGRFGVSGAVMVNLVFRSVLVGGVVGEHGPFFEDTENMLSMHSFSILTSIPLLLLGAVVEERGKVKEQFMKAFRSSPAPIAIARQRDCRIVEVSECWEKFFGHTRAEAIGRTAKELKIYKSEADRENLLAATGGGEPVRDFELPVLTRTGEERQILISVETDEIGGEKCLILIIRDITERKRAEENLRNIAAGVSAKTGGMFFRSLAEHLSKVLEVEYAFVCESLDDGLRARTVASYAHGAHVENIHYPLADSPCEQVLKHGMGVFPRGVKALFLRDEILQGMDVEGYLGVCLKNSAGQPQGLLSVMSREPLDNVESAIAVLKIFAARAAAELERTQAEDKLRLSEQKLRSSEQQYREVVESQTDLICRYREDTTLTFVNEAYCRFFGRSREQLIGTRFIELIPEASRKAVFENIAALSKDLRPISHEHEVILRDGSIGWQHWVDYAILGADDCVTEFQAIGRDVTERRKAERAFRESEERLRQMVEGVQDYAIFMLDLDGRVLTWNATAERLTGFPAKEIIGQPFSRFFNPDDVADGMPESTLSYARATGRSDAEGWHMRRDGSRFWASGIISLVKDDAGAPRGFVRIAHDLTERRDAEQALAESHRKLKLQNDQLRTLAGRLITAQEDERQRISGELHDDIAQRLCVLGLRLHTLGREMPKIAPSLQEHVRTAQRFTDEITIDVHQLSHELHSSRLRSLGLKRALKAWCDEMSAQNEVTIQVSLSGIDDLPGDVSVCAYRVVQEALNNAVKHGKAEQVSVEVRRSSMGVHIRVRDSGCGFNPDIPVNGIGLASMRERLRYFGGDLAVKSAPGSGTELIADIGVPSTHA